MVTPDQRSRECIRRYFEFRTTSPRRRSGQVAASTRASPPHAWRWGTWGRCRRAWARSVRGLSTAAVCRGRCPGRGAVLETTSAFALSFGPTMRRLGSVQRKMPCVFVTEVKEEPSTKREHQPFKVLATETISHKALDADIYSAIPTEKVDGTCCYITNYKGQPYLWARLDRKPNKLAEKRFKNFLHSKQNSKEFFWNVEEDFKPVPECWIPAKEIEQLNGNPMPDENGHIPGWVPVEKNNKQYCWHSSVVNYEFEVALVLKHHPDDPGLLEISAVPLSDLLEQTLELIGTNINGNPYGLGSKKHPLHLLIPHGAFQIRNLPNLKHNDLLSWFEGCREGKIEGIVWHCNDGCLIKVHRHHLGLCWPIPDTYMNSKPVIINMNLNKYDHAFDTKSLFNLLSKIDNQKFGRLRDIILDV